MRLGLSLPPVTQALTAALVVLSLAVAGMRYSKYAQLVAEAQLQPQTDSRPTQHDAPVFANIAVPSVAMEPGLVLSYPWTLATASFVELSVVPFAVSLACVALGGRYLERAWGSRGLAKFVALQTLVPNVACFVLFNALYAATGSTACLFTVVHGTIALQTGVLVALKQLVPEHSLVLLQGLLKTQIKYLAVPAVLLYSIIGLALGQWPKIVLAWAGFFSAWVYLRFYRVQYIEAELPLSSHPTAASAAADRTRIRGDASDTFALSTFFYPPAVADAVAAVSAPIYDVLVALRLCTPFSQDDVDASNLQASRRLRSAGGAPGFHDAEAERRRELARRALEERLRASASS